MLIFELKLAVYNDPVAIPEDLHLFFLNFSKSFSDVALVLGQLFTVDWIDSCVLDSLALISKPSHAEQCLAARSVIRESAQNQHCNSFLVIFCAEVQASAAKGIVDEVNGVPAACFHIHVLNLLQVKLWRDLGDPFFFGETCVGLASCVDEHTGVLALPHNKGTLLIKRAQIELLVNGGHEIFLLLAIRVDFEVESFETLALYAFLIAIVSSCSEANGLELVGLDALVELKAISEHAIITFVNDVNCLFPGSSFWHLRHILHTLAPLEFGIFRVGNQGLVPFLVHLH